MIDLRSWTGSRALLLMPFLAVFLAGGSGDCGPEPAEVYGCESDAECGAGEACNLSTGQCIVVDTGGGDGGASASCPAGGTTSGRVRAQDTGNPTAAEQFLLEELNRTRANPLAEAARLGIALGEGTNPPLTGEARPPLASNATLLRVAREHSADMLARNFFAHTNPDGLDPFDRMEVAGYPYSAAGENLYMGMSTASISPASEAARGHDGLFVDADYPGRGHRVGMLNPAVTEVGIGAAVGEYYNSGRWWNAVTYTQDFGAPASAVTPFVLGVVFRDANRNGRYDIGEGLGGVTVEVQGATAATGWTDDAGGYAFAVEQGGVFALRFSGGDLDAARCQQVEVRSVSRKVDLIAD